MSSAAEELIRNIIEGTRDALLRATQEDCKPLPAPAAPDLTARFQGCCGLAQCIAGYALQDAGLKVRPVATQSLRDYWHGHAALSVEVAEAQGRNWFILDPTFCQFCAVQPDDAVPLPAFHLQQSAEGAALLAALLEDGYAALTADRAILYLAAFCRGTSPFERDKAFDFLKNPPSHPYHFRRDVDCEDFSRDNLARRGLLISRPGL